MKHENKTELMLITSVELSIFITYLLQSLLAILKFPSNSLSRIWTMHKTVILLLMHISPILLGHATLNCVVLASNYRFLTSTAAATLVSAFVLSRIDYCNSLLLGSTHDVTSDLQHTELCSSSNLALSKII